MKGATVREPGSAGRAGSPGVADSSAAGTAQAPDGTPLFLRHWPASGRPWAVMLMVHGIAEHSGRYDRTGRLFAEAGIDVHSFDLRGHGRSGGREVYVERWRDYLTDVASRLVAVRKPGLPLVLLGHSMGSTIALSYVRSDLATGEGRPDLLVLSALTVNATIPPLLRAVAPILSRVAPRHVVANPIAPEELSRDSAIGQSYLADPLVRPRSTTRLGAELLGAMASLRRDPSVPIPALVLHGGEDRLVPTESSELVEGQPGVERHVIPGLRHEIFNEPEGPEVVALAVDWLRRQVEADRPT